MTLVQTYRDAKLKATCDVVNQRFQLSVYDISPAVLDLVLSKSVQGNTVTLLSGSWRFNFDATYIEHKTFATSTLKLHKNTVFVDWSNLTAVDTLMSKLQAKNILILHSGMFCRYRHIDTVVDQMLYYKKFNPGQITLSTPSQALDFNRLKYSVNDIASKYQAKLLDNNLIFSHTCNR